MRSFKVMEKRVMETYKKYTTVPLGKSMLTKSFLASFECRYLYLIHCVLKPCYF